VEDLLTGSNLLIKISGKKMCRSSQAQYQFLLTGQEQSQPSKQVTSHISLHHQAAHTSFNKTGAMARDLQTRFMGSTGSRFWN
jgi:hypothetical protein